MTADPIEEQLRRVDRDPIGASQVMAAAIARAEREGLVDVAYTITDTPIGPLLVAATEAGLVRVAFETEDLDQVLAGLAERIAPRVLASPARLDPVRRELDEYFHCRRQQFDVPLDWRLSSGFRRTVLEHLRADVPYGQTVTYGDLATMAGNPKAARAVGTAMATNPIPIVVPCHRVLRTGGNLGGYGGGLALKVALLDLESGAETLF